MSEFWYPLSISTIGEEEVDAATEVLRSGRTTMGEKVEEFEEKFAEHLGVRHAVMVNSGSSADLLLAHATSDEHPGRVLISAVTWPTHVWSFIHAGYRVRFVDVEGLNTTVEKVEREITDHTTAISIVHLMGIPADVDDFWDLTITEDCCEALGASPVGLSPSAWSFFFSHQMTTMEGGMVTTHDDDLALKLRSMRAHGWDRPTNLYNFVNPGFNVRPTEISAAIGLVQLSRLGWFNSVRASHHDAFVGMLDGCPGIDIPVASPHTTPSYFGMAFFADDRDGLSDHLQSKGVETRPILGGNLLRQPAFSHLPPQHLPGADRVHDHGLFIGLHPTPDSGIEKVAQHIWEFCT